VVTAKNLLLRALGQNRLRLILYWCEFGAQAAVAVAARLTPAVLILFMAVQAAVAVLL
jgi:hypothetical protein